MTSEFYFSFLKQWTSQYVIELSIGYVTGDYPQHDTESGRIKNLKYDAIFYYPDVIAKYFRWHHIPFSTFRQPKLVTIT